MSFFLKEGEIINRHSQVTSSNSVRALFICNIAS